MVRTERSPFIWLVRSLVTNFFFSLLETQQITLANYDVNKFYAHLLCQFASQSATNANNYVGKS